MPALHLVADRRGHVGERERPLLLGHARMEHDLEQQVAEFVLQVVEIAAIDGVGDFVRFLDRVRRNGRERLLHVPRTTGLRIAQAGHDGEEAVDGITHRQTFLCHPERM